MGNLIGPKKGKSTEPVAADRILAFYQDINADFNSIMLTPIVCNFLTLDSYFDSCCKVSQRFSVHKYATTSSYKFGFSLNDNAPLTGAKNFSVKFLNVNSFSCVNLNVSHHLTSQVFGKLNLTVIDSKPFEMNIKCCYNSDLCSIGVAFRCSKAASENNQLLTYFFAKLSKTVGVGGKFVYQSAELPWHTRALNTIVCARYKDPYGNVLATFYSARCMQCCLSSKITERFLIALAYEKRFKEESSLSLGYKLKINNKFNIRASIDTDGSICAAVRKQLSEFKVSVSVLLYLNPRNNDIKMGLNFKI